MAQPRAAVIGAGLMGLWHAKAVRRAGGRLALVVDCDAARAGVLASRYAGCAHAASLDEVSADAIDVVHVCTPTSTHEALVRTSLQAGWHVLVEKPLAADGPGTRALLALAESRGRLLCPVHQVLFQRGVQRALAARARIRPLHIDLVMCTAGAEGLRLSRDDLVAEILPHPLSLLALLLPLEASPGRWSVERPMAGELRATLHLQDLTASILVSTRGRPTVNGARVIGEGGTVHLDFFHGFATFQNAAVSRSRKVLQPFGLAAELAGTALTNLAVRSIRRQPAYPGLWELVSRFYEAVGGAGASPVPAADAIRVADMRDALLVAVSAP